MEICLAIETVDSLLLVIWVLGRTLVPSQPFGGHHGGSGARRRRWWNRQIRVFSMWIYTSDVILS